MQNKCQVCGNGTLVEESKWEMYCNCCGTMIYSPHDDITYRLKKRAEIRRQIPTRKSVQNGEPDRIADLLEEAYREIIKLRNHLTDW
jgi:hypothetical protein